MIFLRDCLLRRGNYGGNQERERGTTINWQTFLQTATRGNIAEEEINGKTFQFHLLGKVFSTK